MVPPLVVLLPLLHLCHGEGGTGDWDYHSQYRLPVPRAQDQAPRAQDQVPRAQDRMDPGSGIDAALLRQVLEDPVLLQAVDPNVLQMVLVQAATANLLTRIRPPSESELPLLANEALIGMVSPSLNGDVSSRGIGR